MRPRGDVVRHHPELRALFAVDGDDEVFQVSTECDFVSCRFVVESQPPSRLQQSSDSKKFIQTTRAQGRPGLKAIIAIQQVHSNWRRELTGLVVSRLFGRQYI